jgi:hypothetical protein
VADRDSTTRLGLWQPTPPSKLLSESGGVAPEPSGNVSTGLMDTLAGCREAALIVFQEIKRRHGKAEAERIFVELGAPSKERRKRGTDRMLLLCFAATGWTMEKYARHLANNAVERERVLGVNSSPDPDALRKRLNRVVVEFAASRRNEQSRPNFPRKKSLHGDRTIRRQKVR